MKALKIVFIVFAIIASYSLNAQGVSINTTGIPPHASAALDVSSTDKGMLIPRMDTEQRNTISSPEHSLLIFNTTIQCFEAYNATTSTWVDFGCIGTDPPTSVTAVATPNSLYEGSTLTLTGFAAGATSWRWTGPNGFTSSFKSPTILNITLAGAGIYTLVASNNYGSVTAHTASVVVNFLCGKILAINHTAGQVAPATKTVTYGTVTYVDKCWITRNLGATNQASEATDATEASAGWYWQFNRKQGYIAKSYPEVTFPDWNTTLYDESSDWLVVNDPCTIELGTGWRIPTKTEWTNANVAGAWENYTDTYASVLKLHAAGFMVPANGSLNNPGSRGSYWSSTQLSLTNGSRLSTGDNFSTMVYSLEKSYGSSVRCIRD